MGFDADSWRELCLGIALSVAIRVFTLTPNPLTPRRIYDPSRERGLLIEFQFSLVSCLGHGSG